MKDNTRVPPVLFLGDHFGYAEGVAHGVTIYFLNVIPALAAAGVEVAACFLREPHAAAAGLGATGVEPVFLSAHRMDPRVVFRVAEIAKQRRSRVIHASGIKATLVARAVARLLGTETIVHVHDLKDPGLALSALHGIFARPTDIGLCVSAAVRETTVKGYHVPADRIRVLHNGAKLDHIKNVPADARSSRRAELGIDAAADVITLVGRIYPVKGHAAMLQMLPEILRRRPRTVLLLVGDGPDRATCEALADELGVRANVRFAGHRADVPELLAASDLVVVPSLTEGLSYAAIEALAAGRPVVAHAVGGLKEVVTDRVDGRWVALGDRQAFVQAVVELLDDRRLLDTYSRAAAANAERFSLERHVDGLLRIYGELAGGAAT